MSHQHNTRKKSNAAALAGITISSGTIGSSSVTTAAPTTVTTTSVSNLFASAASPTTSFDLPKPTILDNTKSVNPSKPPLTPRPENLRPDSGIKLQEIVARLEREVARLSKESSEKDVVMKKMEERISQLECDQMRTQSYFIIHNRTTQLLQQRIANLEQYTIRYSVIVKGLERAPGYEQHDSLVEEVEKIVESSNSVPFTEVDKLHRNGPRKENVQDVIVRFKSHSAKEAFYKKRKELPNKNIKIQPSLSPDRKKLLETAREQLEAYHSEAESYSNPPHFLLPDEHGNLLLKFRKKTKDGLFLRFNSLQEMHALISKYNAFPEADASFEVEIRKIENGDPKDVVV